MSTDVVFVQACADRLGVGYLTQGKPLSELRDTIFKLLGTRNIASVDHLRRLLTNSPAAYVLDLHALKSEEEKRLVSILTAK